MSRRQELIDMMIGICAEARDVKNPYFGRVMAVTVCHPAEQPARSIRLSRIFRPASDQDCYEMIEWALLAEGLGFAPIATDLMARLDA